MDSVCLGFHSAMVSGGAWLRQMFDVFEAGIEEKMKWKRGVQTNLDLYIFLSISRQQDLQRLYQHLQLTFSMEHCFSTESGFFNFLLTAVNVGDRFVNAMGNHQ